MDVALIRSSFPSFLGKKKKRKKEGKKEKYTRAAEAVGVFKAVAGVSDSEMPITTDSGLMRQRDGVSSRFWLAACLLAIAAS